MGFSGQKDSYRAPWVSAMWSAAFPGFGQLYNRDYVVGLTLVALEMLVNVKSNLNLSIYHAFRGETARSFSVVSTEWIMIYPCVYSYAIWQAYTRALENNRRLEDDGFPRPAATSHLNGVFLGAAMGGTLGVIYRLLDSYVFGGLLAAAVGALIGSLLESLLVLKVKK